MRYLFEDYALDTSRRELLRRGEPVLLEPQVFDLLAYLVQNRDRVLTKDDVFSAVWNGRLVSESALTTRINAARAAVGDSGQEQRLIRTLRGRGFRFVADVSEIGEGRVEQSPATTFWPALPNRPSIAVLPFDNMSCDPGQAYFADGIVEDITTALSRLRWLFVIARNSSFTYRPPIDVQQVGRELGVRYILEGSVRKADRKIRISAQLIDAATRTHIWADKYDGDLSEVFTLQDNITSSVVAKVEPVLHEVEATRVKSKPVANLDAYDLYLRSLADLSSMTNTGYAQAETNLRRAIGLEPMFADAIATLADVILRQALSGAIKDTHTAHQEARDLARRAVLLQPDNGSALATAAWALAGAREWDEALSLTEKARQLQPSSAHVRFRCGAIYVYDGEFEKAIGEFTEGWRLNPKDKRGYHPHVGIATAYFFQRRFEDAIAWARRGMAETNAVAIPQRFIAASLAHLGRLSEAREVIEALLILQPSACLARARTSSYRHPWMLDLYVDGLREAGLPEEPR